MFVFYIHNGPLGFQNSSQQTTYLLSSLANVSYVALEMAMCFYVNYLLHFCYLKCLEPVVFKPLFLG